MLDVLWSARYYAFHVDVGNSFNIIVFVRYSVVVRGIMILVNFAFECTMCREEFTDLFAYTVQAFLLVGRISVPQDLRRRWSAGRARNVNGFETLYRLAVARGSSYGYWRLLLSLSGGCVVIYLCAHLPWRIRRLVYHGCRQIRGVLMSQSRDRDRTRRRHNLTSDPQ